ncbi:MAG: polysaccharide deacetylase family protein [Candidatus Omnitrophota bacterium]|jgi:peptidoglycan/xylan/chitin deacetylase (PgdA/CDA1 family)|nr:MAG: polysaccharide deacetylase family protein [Candidatus Omnitrophota bacterium]
MGKWLKIIVGVILGSAALFFFAGWQCLETRVLMYHSVKPHVNPKDKLAVSTRTFRQQMELLDAYHYSVIPLEALAMMLRDKRPIPPRAIAITFDDANEDTFLYAFPVLRAYDFAATVFVVTEYVSRPYKLTWEEIRRMQKSGLVSVGSHGITHSALKGIKSGEGLKREIADSKVILEKMLGTPVRLFSYPFGEYNARLKNMVKDAGYSAAVASRPWGSCVRDTYALGRFGIFEGSRTAFEVWLTIRELYIGVLEFFKTVKSRLKINACARRAFYAGGFAFHVG